MRPCWVVIFAVVFPLTPPKIRPEYGFPLAYMHPEEMRQCAFRVIAYENRIPLGYAGVPYDVYDIRDFETVHTRYKAAVFLIPWATKAMTAAVGAWRASGRLSVLSDPDHPDLTPAEISALCGEAGCHLYAAPGDVLHASAHWVLLHAASAGEKTIRLTGVRTVTDCISGESLRTDTLTFSAAEYETRLFRLD